LEIKGLRLGELGESEYATEDRILKLRFLILYWASLRKLTWVGNFVISVCGAA